jgi:hypothetical protein
MAFGRSPRKGTDISATTLPPLSRLRSGGAPLSRNDHGDGGRCYIVRAANGAVTYMSAQETPLALSHLVGNEAAELRFLLEDAKDGEAALACLVKVLTAHWASKPTMQPKPELIQ